jgi:hypothetical protein
MPSANAAPNDDDVDAAAATFRELESVAAFVT